MSKFIGFIVGAIEIGVGIAIGNPALIVQGGLTIAAQAIVDLTAPKTPARDASEMTIQLGEQPRVMGVGEFYMPGSLVDGFDYGGKYGTDHEVLVIRLLDEAAESLTGFYVNDEYVPYTGDGNYPQFDSHHLSLWFRANTSVDPLPSVVTTHGPGWTSADIGASGCDVIVDYLADAPQAKHPAWPGGRPRFGFVLKGGKRYDPRKDSTVVGGSGSHRIDDPTTWEWTANAIINWYAFERGVYVDGDNSDQSKLLIGRGLSATESPPENIFAAANLCDDEPAAIFPYQQIADPGFGGSYYFSPDHTKAVVGGGGGGGLGFMIIDVPTRSVIATSASAVSTGHLAVNNDGSFITGSYDPGSGARTAVLTPGGGISDLGSAMSGGVWNVSAGLFGIHNLIDNNLLTTTSSTAVGFHPARIFDDLSGNSWAVGGVGDGSGSGYNTGIGFYDIVGAASHIVSTSTQGNAFGFEADAGVFFVAQEDTLYLIDKTLFTIISSVSPSGLAISGRSFRNSESGDPWIWVARGSNWERYSTHDLSLLETIDPSDFGVVVTAGAPIYDPINDAIWTEGTLEDHLTIRFLHRNGGYRVAGPIYSNQEHLEVEQMFASAVGGNIITHEGSVLIEPGQAKSVSSTFSDDDLVVGTKVSWNQGFLSESNSDWLNTVVGNYIEPDQKWNPHNTPPLRDNSDIVADGKPREQQNKLRLVRHLAQAMRVCEYARRLGRLWGRATVTLGPRFCEIEEGDWVQWQSDRYFAGGTKTFRVDGYNIDEKWQNTLTLREISATVYADDATFPSDKSIPTRTPPPIDIGKPDSGNWTLTATTLDSSGASVPALHIVGDTSDDTNASAIIVEYWKYDGVTDPTADPDSIAWTQVGTYPPSSTFTKDITSLAGAGTYYAAISYVVSGETSDRLVLGPETIDDLTVAPSTSTLTASGAIAAGNFVNIFASSGAKVRKADATDDTKPVNGFAPAAIANAATGVIRGPGGKITGLSSLTPGATYYLDTTPGAITATPPSGSGNLVQEVGVAVSATELLFNPRQGVTL